MLGTAVILAVTAAGGEGGAEEQNAEDAAAGEDADNSNTNAGDKPSSTSGKSQLAIFTNQEFDILLISDLHWVTEILSVF